MKFNYSFLIIAGLMLCLTACLKDHGNLGQINSASIAGRWNIASDSTFAGVGFGNHPVNYNGKPGDYFDFRTDGNVYTKEGTVLDTLNYNLASNAGIVIRSFGLTINGVPETGDITALTAHSLVIVAPKIFTPGGTFGRKISLTR